MAPYFSHFCHGRPRPGSSVEKGCDIHKHRGRTDVFLGVGTQLIKRKFLFCSLQRSLRDILGHHLERSVINQYFNNQDKDQCLDMDGEEALKLDWRFGAREGGKRRRRISHLDSFFYCRVRVRPFVRSSIRVYKAYRTYYYRPPPPRRKRKRPPTPNGAIETEEFIHSLSLSLSLKTAISKRRV